MVFFNAFVLLGVKISYWVGWLVFHFHIHKTKNVLNLTVRCSPEGGLSVSAVFGEHKLLCKAMPCFAGN